MGKSKLLVITTAFHHKHRYRLHNFLPYLSRYFDIDIVDIPIFSYDKADDESIMSFLAKAIKEILRGGVKKERIKEGVVYTVRSICPGDFGALSTLPTLNLLFDKLSFRKYHAILATPFLAGFITLQFRSKFPEIPIVYEDVDRFFDFFNNPFHRLTAKTVELWTVRNSDRVITASPYLYLEDMRIRRGESTYFIPNGIEYERFRASASRIEKRNRYALVYVGAVEQWSGLDIGVKAFSLAVRRFPNIKLYIIGEYETPFGTYLFNLIKRLGLRDNVIFLGRRPYDFVVDFLPRCRLGLLTFPQSIVTERAFPYKILEYCATGTPVVMTKVTSLATLVERYNAGKVHDVDDIEGLASSIGELVTDDGIWKEYSKNAMRLALLFDIAKLARLEANVILSRDSVQYVF